jgi:hypothetical protein
MADCVARDQIAVRQRALVLLSVVDRVKSEGWDDGVATQLRQAARELIAMAADGPAAEELARMPGTGRAGTS